MPEHLGTAEFANYLKGSAEPALLLSWDDHLAECDDCRRNLQRQIEPSLAQWAAGLPQDEETGASGRRAVALVFVAAAAVAAMIFIGLRFTTHRNLEASSPLSIPATWSVADKALVSEAIKTGHLPTSAAASDVVAKRGVLLGTPQQDAFEPISPLSQIVETDRPTFRWQSLPSAASYRVTISDQNFQVVVQSAFVSESSWTPATPLARGNLYIWQISAKTSNGMVTVPTPPAPEARFRVLDLATEQRVLAAREQGEAGHVLAACLLSQAGLPSAATQQVQSLPSALQKLLHSVD